IYCRPLEGLSGRDPAGRFWASKTLLSAVELQVFTHLGVGAMTRAELGERAKLHKRGICDFLDALVALRFLDREGDGNAGKYCNTAETAAFLGQAEPHVHRRNPRDVQRPPVWILGWPHRSAPDRSAAERDQKDREADV